MGELEGVIWRLHSLTVDREGVTFPTPTDVSMRFMDDGRVIGSSGCNRFFCQYACEGDALSFGPAGSTLMACSDDVMSIEDAFMGALVQITAWSIREGALHMTDGPGRTEIVMVPLEVDEGT